MTGALTPEQLYSLGLNVAAAAADSMARGIEISASRQPPTAIEALHALARILREMSTHGRQST